MCYVLLEYTYIKGSYYIILYYRLHFQSSLPLSIYASVCMCEHIIKIFQQKEHLRSRHCHISPAIWNKSVGVLAILNQSMTSNVTGPISFLPCDERLIWCVSDVLFVTLGLIVVLLALLCAVVCAGSCMTCRRLKARIQRLNKLGESTASLTMSDYNLRIQLINICTHILGANLGAHNQKHCSQGTMNSDMQESIVLCHFKTHLRTLQSVLWL